MAIGDAAASKGMDLVNGTEAANTLDTEINKTRDYIAELEIDASTDITTGTLPMSRGGTGATSKSSVRSNIGITSGTANPSGGADGDIYFKIV